MELFSEEISSDNLEVAFLLGVWRTLTRNSPGVSSKFHWVEWQNIRLSPLMIFAKIKNLPFFENDLGNCLQPIFEEKPHLWKIRPPRPLLPSFRSHPLKNPCPLIDSPGVSSKFHRVEWPIGLVGHPDDKRPRTRPDRRTQIWTRLKVLLRCSNRLPKVAPHLWNLCRAIGKYGLRDRSVWNNQGARWR